MSCTLTRAEIEEEIQTLEEQLEAARAAYLSAVTGDYKSYRKGFPGGLSQRVDRRNIKEIRLEVEWLRAEIARLRRLLNGCANPAVNLRRRW